MQSIYRLESNMADRGRFDEMVERYVQATEFIDTNAEDARKLSLEVIEFALIPDNLDDLVEDSALIYVDDIDEAKARYNAAFTAEFQYKTIIHGRTTTHTYTAADVLDACFAQSRKQFSHLIGIERRHDATLRIDPVNDLVIVMTRNVAGKDRNKYHQKFIDAILQGIAD